MTKSAIIFGWDVRTCPPGHPARDAADKISGNDNKRFLEAFYEGMDKINAAGVDIDVAFISGENSDDENIDLITSALA
ncbi:hypothetical protein [Pseudomonas viridiflava]|uniref:hypothetical protein n=1 Tax=Pseudomonas viridiflava TaxID=33069 RepID=UPI000C06E92D|nr:hypothetical protein [Pseudomonas viridiflava]PHN62710.1 hypothetical protein AO275_03535 [Pseudomonas viridiflava]